MTRPPAIRSVGTEELPLTRVSTDDLTLTFAASRGGRLISLTVGETELLWHNPALLDDALRPIVPVGQWPDGSAGMSSWANVGGSKTWPAPQGWSGSGEWAGPPDQVLDSGPWQEEVAIGADSVTVRLTSRDDRRSGIRAVRRFDIPATGTAFEQTTTFLNISDVPVRWSIWEVCQVDTSGGAGRPVQEAAVAVPVTARSRMIDLGTWVGEIDAIEQNSTIRLPIGNAVGKRGFTDVPGAVEYQGPDGESLVLSHEPTCGAIYPDGGAQVEVWLQSPTSEPIAALENLHPSAHLVELEVLGPLVSLAPGESTSVRTRWSARARRSSS